MSKLIFSFNLKEVKKVDNFADKSGFLLLAHPSDGSNLKMQISAKLVREAGLLMNGNEYISFGFMIQEDSEIPVPVIAFNAEKSKTSARLAKNGVISNKTIYNKIVEIFNLDTSINNFIIVSDVMSSDDIRFVILNSLNQDKSELSQIESTINLTEENQMEEEFQIPEIQ